MATVDALDATLNARASSATKTPKGSDPANPKSIPMVASRGERRMASSPRPMKRSREEVHGHRLDRGRNPMQILWDSQAPSRIKGEPQEQDHGCQDDTS